jgi:hypothetical protein
MVHFIHAIKSWMELFSVSLKEHSIFRAFKLNQNIPAKNISLCYKESSLCNEWLEINVTNVGILLFHSFPEFTMNPNLVEPKELNRNTIMNLLNISAIVKDLDVQNKEWYLNLYSNSKFYLVSSIIKFFQIRTFLHCTGGIYSLWITYQQIY